MKKIVWLLTALAVCFYAQARAEDVSPDFVTAIAPGIFVAHGRTELVNDINHGAISNRAFIIGDEAVAVIDTGGSLAAGVALRSAIRARTHLPIRYVINTHMHPDHVLGNAAFKAQETVFAGHHKLPRALAARQDQYLQANRALIGEAAFAGTEIVPPTLAVTGEMTVNLGGRALRLTAHPTAHTDNDLTVFDEKTGTLFLGDLVFVEHLPVIDGSLNGWLGVLDGLAAHPAARAVPGHGPTSIDWPGGAEAQRRYLVDLRTKLRAAVRAGWPLAKALDAVPPLEAESWRLVEEFHRRNISAAYSEMEWE
jgi:quinoprotein relay system zinc metallohydrolase 2